jgi:ABC-type polysaccharide/polyol phosphate export permease
LYLLDPAAGAIDNFRQAVIYGKPPNTPEMAWAAAIATVSLAAAYAYFKSSEAIMADII